MLNPFSHRKQIVVSSSQILLEKLENRDPETLRTLQSVGHTTSDTETESLRSELAAKLKGALSAAHNEEHADDNHFESRDPLIGLLQSSLNGSLKTTSDQAAPWAEKFGPADVAGWIPTGVLALMDFLRPKAEFRWSANPESFTYRLPDVCTIFLIADWGADNQHAATISDLIKEKISRSKQQAFVIHLGDIYYSGTEPECRSFLRNWPLRDPVTDRPLKDHSFSLNGNHEMYSGGRSYMSIVLPAFNQPASYFQIRNQHWRFFGLDTAYVPFRLKDDDNDRRIRPQWDWLVGNINADPQPRNIFLSHHQPFSAFRDEHLASAPLRENIDELLGNNARAGAIRRDGIFAWFFGHEHRCTIYDDSKTPFRARLIGNGSIPHRCQNETTPQELIDGTSCTSFMGLRHDPLNAAGLAKSGYVQMTVAGDSIGVIICQ